MKHRLETMVIYNAPEDITEAKLGIFEISRVLSGAGINPVSVDIYGASFCRVSMKAGAADDPVPMPQQDPVITDVPASLTPEPPVYTLADALTEAIVRSTGCEASRLIIDWNCRDHQMLTEPADGDRFTIIPASAITLGAVRFEVIDNNSPSGDKAGGGSSRSRPLHNRLQVDGNVRYLCNSVFSLQPLRPGQIITKDDVKLVSNTVTDMSDCGIGDIDAVVGQEVALSIRSNQVLLPSMIKKITLIKRNDLVDVWSMAGNVSISMTGRALSDGAYGDVISVRDERNKTVLRGTVTGAGTVTVAHAEAITQADNSPARSEVSTTNQAIYAQNKVAGIK
jgi:flagella basal body P-ring formation protein FlgA